MFSFMTALSYVKMYWKMFLVVAVALFVAYLFYSIYSLKQDINTLTLNNNKLVNENDKLTSANENNKASISKLQAEIVKKDALFSDTQKNNQKGITDIKKLISGLDTNATFSFNNKDCKCDSIKILQTKGDFIHETISNIGNLNK